MIRISGVIIQLNNMLKNYFRFCSSKKSLYDVLGIRSNASQDDIKKRFHELAKQHHPDSTQAMPGSEVSIHNI
jgi:preprotein translocase subunit Sec63